MLNELNELNEMGKAGKHSHSGPQGGLLTLFLGYPATLILSRGKA